ncbi:glutamate racemase [Rhodoblastus acidophilus]|uniref:Glutamate racemase n=1 Tax=Candidatus Rhodoblastus alkanivorans TaxID=2954117 RepID=A0ABS9Z616_9HYPH|nr:glutamate racemase [Candidatus Rhodoblastus alkanivorans]MCI4678649.1 glutamate racemase [Candidatus Rhodoblastus alkanivorans]MCI4683058.1 glutamate racemase [Candidatus Rhodoblastus alkanivorans]MDI4640369.1 glutamate racemase [Rhodoblastus acidophilus]
MNRAPRILVFDSGLGGLTVFRALAAQRPDADYVYAADDLGFPYGLKSEEDVKALVLSAVERLIADHAPDCVVIACNTASTLVLPLLRARWPEIPFVGTVPAIKPAAELSQSRLISVLATPGTVARDYTRDLIEKFASACEVALVGSTHLAELAEAYMQGESVADDAIAREIAPCFASHDGRRTDAVVLACTHYPLLQDFFTRLAPWPVRWIDPAPAIARRADQVLSDRFPAHAVRDAGFTFVFTSGAAPAPRLLKTIDILRQKIAREPRARASG